MSYFHEQVLPALLANVVFQQLFSFGDNTLVLPPARPAVEQPSQYSAISGRSYFEYTSRSRYERPSGATRRKDISRCRTLRTRIQSFEEEFEAKSSRKPHGVEREPLAATYAEYRSLKQRIRDSAATHIQAVWRSFLCRKRLLSSAAATAAGSRRRRGSVPLKTNGSVSSVSTKLSGMSGLSSVGSASIAPTPAESASALDKLARLRAEKSALKQRLRAYDTKFAKEHDRPPSKADKEHLRPQYQRYHDLKDMIVALESSVGGGGGGDRDDRTADVDGDPTSVEPTTLSGISTHSGISITGNTASLSHAGATPSGPFSSDHALAIDARGRPTSSSSAASAAGARSSVQSITTSSGNNSGSGSASRLDTSSLSSAALLLPDDLSSADLAFHDTPGRAASSGSQNVSTPASVPTLSTGSVGTSSALLRSDDALREIKAEKRRLQVFLRDYERAFEAREGRKVQYVRDISPVIDSYQRYKHYKALLKEQG